MAAMQRVILAALMLEASAAWGQGGGGLSVPENPKPLSIDERVKELEHTREFLTRLHDLMHQLREAPNEAERERLRAEELKLLNIWVAPHAGPPVPQDEVQRRIEREAAPPPAAK